MNKNQPAATPITEEGARTAEQLFTQADMREAFYQGMDHQNMPWKYFGFDEWIEKYKEERGNK